MVESEVCVRSLSCQTALFSFHFLHRLHICIQNLLIFSRIPSSLYLCTVSCASGCLTTPKHNIFVLLTNSSPLCFFTNLLLLILAKELTFNSICPKHLSAKPPRLTYDFVTFCGNSHPLTFAVSNLSADFMHI